MLVERMPPVVEDCVERAQVGRIGIEPGIHVLGLNVDDCPVMAGLGDLGLRVIGDGGEGQQIGFPAGRIYPVRPQAQLSARSRN